MTTPTHHKIILAFFFILISATLSYVFLLRPHLLKGAQVTAPIVELKKPKIKKTTLTKTKTKTKLAKSNTETNNAKENSTPKGPSPKMTITSVKNIKLEAIPLGPENFTTNSPREILSGKMTRGTEEILINNSSSGVVYPNSTTWQKVVELKEGLNRFEITPKDEFQNRGVSKEVTIFLDSISPKTYLILPTEAHSKEFPLAWSSEDQGAEVDYYEIEFREEGDRDWSSWILETRESKVNFDVFKDAKPEDLDERTFYFRIRSTDKAGNVEPWKNGLLGDGKVKFDIIPDTVLQSEMETQQDIIRIYNPLDVVINEIAWTGTKASASDEWIELYNNTDADIDLTGFTLKSADGSINIALNGSIRAKGFYLLERTSDSTVSDIVASQIYSGVLGNTGETLELKDHRGNLIDRIDAVNGWMAGDNTTKQTMERKDAKKEGSLKDNWSSNNTQTKNGLDAQGNQIQGTPNTKNSAAVL